LIALSATLENWDDRDSEATDDLSAAIICFFYEIIDSEIKDDLWLRS